MTHKLKVTSREFNSVVNGLINSSLSLLHKQGGLVV